MSIQLPIRPRRLRKSNAIRSLVRETHLSPHDFILPLFVHDAGKDPLPIASMPGCFRLEPKDIVKECTAAYEEGIQGVALFPAIEDALKDSTATESYNPDGLLQNTIKAIKDAIPEMLVITDVAMDPYSSDGHDGYVKDGEILNDPTLEILATMAVAQAAAGADMVAPSDMMDGRIGAIRQALDSEGYGETSILSYAVKYASAFYGPFRDALDSAPRGGDKKTYQMDPANMREAYREVALDIEEGADIVMVKPGLPYLDVIARIKDSIDIPLAAYHVSGEFAMLKAAGERGWLNYDSVMLEALMSLKRAGSDLIFTYNAREAARRLQA